MTVSELIEALRKMPQDAGITIYAGYDIEYGPSYEQVEGAGYNPGLSDCKLAIDNLNLGIKIK